MLQQKKWAMVFAVLALVACVKINPESATDPFPMPAEMEKNKDLSVDPGDSFYDYCLGTWLKNTPIPASGSVGGMYEQDELMVTRVEELKASVPDLGGFLVALDAYKARLAADGYRGAELDKQLRKFYEGFADLWRVQYSDAKFASFPKKDVHSHARLRVNGVVMNTDLWYNLYQVDRDNNLYLPKERRAYIW